MMPDRFSGVVSKDLCVHRPLVGSLSFDCLQGGLCGIALRIKIFVPVCFGCCCVQCPDALGQYLIPDFAFAKLDGLFQPSLFMLHLLAHSQHHPN